MIRFGSLTLCLTFCAGLLACGSGNGKETPPKDPLQLVPGDNTVSGWTVDRTVNRNPNGEPMTGVTKLDVEGLIDGAATPFYLDPYAPKLFIWQNYVNTTLPSAPPPFGATVVLYILEMPSADQATGLYSAVLGLSEYNPRTTEGWTATDPTLGTESRMQDTNTQWWINFHKGVYYVELSLNPSTGPAPDFTPGNTETKKEAVRFAQAIASKM